MRSETYGEDQDPIRLPVVRQRAAQVAGPLSRLRRVEYPRGDGDPGASFGPRCDADGYERIPVPIGELSRVLGGGIVPGSVVLISGDPGIGKSTILIQLCAALAEIADLGGPVLYVSGEESAAQIKLRAERLGIASQNVLVLADTRLESIMAHIERTQPRLVVVDSVQSIYSDAIASGAGSVTQVRDCSAQLLRLAKSQTFPLFLVGHVTKEGWSTWSTP
jgi:DNA repair protein RadA/Sms